MMIVVDLIVLLTCQLLSFFASISSASAVQRNYELDRVRSSLGISKNTLFETTHKVAVCVITTSVELAQWKWLDELAHEQISVYIMVDADHTELRHLSNDIRVVSISHNISKSLGYHGAWNKNETSTRRANGWDKALLYFTEIVTFYDFVWFIEDDVYIHSVSSFLRVHEDTMRAKADFTAKFITMKDS